MPETRIMSPLEIEGVSCFTKGEISECGQCPGFYFMHA